MICPHNSYKAEHTTGLKLPLAQYLRALTAARWKVEGTMTHRSTTVTEEEDGSTTSTSTVAFRFNGTLAMKHLRADKEWREANSETLFTTKAELELYDLWPADEPKPWQLYAGDIPNEDDEALLDVLWLGKLNGVMITQSDGDAPVEAPRGANKYEYLLLPMGGGKGESQFLEPDLEDPAGIFANLDYANPGGEVVVRMCGGGYDLVVEGRGPWNAYFQACPLQCFLVSLECYKADFETGTTDSVTWVQQTAAQFVIGGESYDLTVLWPRFTSSGEGYSATTEFVSSSIKLTAEWD